MGNTIDNFNVSTLIKDSNGDVYEIGDLIGLNIERVGTVNIYMPTSAALNNIQQEAAAYLAGNSFDYAQTVFDNGIYTQENPDYILNTAIQNTM